VAAQRTFDDEDHRLRRRDRACVFTGAVIGASLGAFAGVIVPLGGVVFALMGAGALAGGVVGKAAAQRISATEWDPLQDNRPYVGTNSPDDDITR
jgi:hypothetical protein